MRDIAWIDNDRAIAVGDGGTVWISQDGGARWSDVSRNIAATDAVARDQVDVAARLTRLELEEEAARREAARLAQMDPEQRAERLAARRKFRTNN